MNAINPLSVEIIYLKLEDKLKSKLTYEDNQIIHRCRALGLGTNLFFLSIFLGTMIGARRRKIPNLSGIQQFSQSLKLFCIMNASAILCFSCYIICQRKILSDFLEILNKYEANSHYLLDSIIYFRLQGKLKKKSKLIE